MEIFSKNEGICIIGNRNGFKHQKKEEMKCTKVQTLGAQVNACAVPLIDGLGLVLAVTRGLLPARADESDAG